MVKANVLHVVWLHIVWQNPVKIGACAYDSSHIRFDLNKERVLFIGKSGEKERWTGSMTELELLFIT